MKQYKSKTDYTTIEVSKDINNRIKEILKEKKGLKKRHYTNSLLISALKAKKLW